MPARKIRPVSSYTWQLPQDTSRQQFIFGYHMTPDERAQLIEDIRRSALMRQHIIEQASLDKAFDIAAAWDTLDELDQSIGDRVITSRSQE